MKKEIYIDWDNNIVMTDPEEYINNYVADNVDDMDIFSEWLDDKYSASDLWKMDSAQCEDVMDDWKDYLRRQADEEFDYCFDAVDVYFPDEE